jgi:hypothetical protein
MLGAVLALEQECAALLSVGYNWQKRPEDFKSLPCPRTATGSHCSADFHAETCSLNRQ